MREKIQQNHPLVGRWVDYAEDTDMVVLIDSINEYLKVSAHCISDGEQFKIKNTSWDGSILTFYTEMPSTGWKTKHQLTLREDGKVNLELTTFEVLKKKN